MPTTNYYTANGRIRSESSGGTRTGYLPDALGSVTATVQDGAVVNTYRFKPYGSQLSKTGAGADPRFQWVGQWGYRQIGASGIDAYVRGRHYGQHAGRWSSVDRLWPRESSYNYVAANPVNNLDPRGSQVIFIPLLKGPTIWPYEIPLRLPTQTVPRPGPAGFGNPRGEVFPGPGASYDPFEELERKRRWEEYERQARQARKRWCDELHELYKDSGTACNSPQNPKATVEGCYDPCEPREVILEKWKRWCRCCMLRQLYFEQCADVGIYKENTKGYEKQVDLACRKCDECARAVLGEGQYGPTWRGPFPEDVPVYDGPSLPPGTIIV